MIDTFIRIIVGCVCSSCIMCSQPITIKQTPTELPWDDRSQKKKNWVKDLKWMCDELEFARSSLVAFERGKIEWKILSGCAIMTKKIKFVKYLQSRSFFHHLDGFRTLSSCDLLKLNVLRTLLFLLSINVLIRLDFLQLMMMITRLKS